MKRSNINTEDSDFKFVKEPTHINNVWLTIEKNIPIYFQKIINSDENYIASPTLTLKRIFDDAFKEYRKEDQKYKAFFGTESMQEFEDENDPKTFKSALSKRVPVILKARNSKRELMQEWQERYAASKPADIYSIFFNLIIFMDEFAEEINPADFGVINNLADLDALTIFHTDEDYSVPGVIGAGIQSSVMYNINPQYFLCANKNTLYGYHFLSDCETFGLPSRSNEFIMINDLKDKKGIRSNRNIMIDQNYWYPFDLFILYSLRTYRVLKALCSTHKCILDDEYRFVYVNAFMSQIWKMKIDIINTMTGGDQQDAT